MNVLKRKIVWWNVFRKRFSDENKRCIFISIKVSMIIFGKNKQKNNFLMQQNAWPIQNDPKTWKVTETLACGYLSESTQWELSNEYQYGRV